MKNKLFKQKLKNLEFQTMHEEIIKRYSIVYQMYMLAPEKEETVFLGRVVEIEYIGKEILHIPDEVFELIRYKVETNESNKNNG